MSESFFDKNLEKKDKKPKNSNSFWIIVFVWTLIIIGNITTFYLVDRCYSVIVVDLLSICLTTLYLRREWQRDGDKAKLTLKVLIKVVIILIIFSLVLYLFLMIVFVPFSILFILPLPFLAVRSFKVVDELFSISTTKKKRKELILLIFLVIIYIVIYFILSSIFSPETMIL